MQPLEQPSDPFFLLGNYRFLVLPHVSGVYQLMCGQRAWGRLNDCDTAKDYGSNNAVVHMNGEQYNLTGVTSLAADKKTVHQFGAGFASYTYFLPNGVRCIRSLHVKPSISPKNGISAMLIKVELSNAGDKEIKVDYRESITARYKMISEVANKDISYLCHARVDNVLKAMTASFTYSSKDPYLIVDRKSVSRYDGFPPVLFMATIRNTDGSPTLEVVKHDSLSADMATNFAMDLKPGETKTCWFIVGYNAGKNPDNGGIKAIIDSLTKAAKQAGKDISSSIFSNEWRKVLPRFKKEPDTIIRRELVWDAYVLEALAKYSEYYDETFVPQGMVYDFVWGKPAAARDLLIAALPLCHYNPKLAKSTLRLVMKKMFTTGLIEYTDFGYGAQTSFMHKTSDQQLFFLMLVAEYLEQTKDYAFLTEQTDYYPSEAKYKGTTLQKIERAFLYIRDEIGVGPHGLSKILNSDWNDVVFNQYPINMFYGTAESHMNSSIAMFVFYKLLAQLKVATASVGNTNRNGLLQMIGSMQMYRDQQMKMFMKDMGNRNYPYRLYLNEKIKLGDSSIYLEPSIFLLNVPDIDVAIKKKVYNEIQTRLMNNEPLGAREMESTKANNMHDAGERENGGYWYSLNGPLMLGLSTFDKAESMDLYKKMTFSNFSKNYPNGWVGQWTAPDAINSSLAPKPGDITTFSKPYPAFCSHAHLWTLLGYFYLYEN